MGTSRRRLGVILRFVIAAYVAALATLPFGHHDLACHVKTSTHCGACHVGTSGDHGALRPSPAAAMLADAGQALPPASLSIVSCAISPSAGRAPPAF